MVDRLIVVIYWQVDDSDIGLLFDLKDWRRTRVYNEETWISIRDMTQKGQ